MTPAEMLAIEQACERLIRRFAWANDAQDHDAVAAMFTQDGSFARPTAPDAPVTGREAIRAFFRDRPKRATRHVMSNVLVDVEDDGRALARSYVTLYSGEGGKDVLVGAFHDVLVRDPASGWLFAQRRGSLAFA